MQHIVWRQQISSTQHFSRNVFISVNMQCITSAKSVWNTFEEYYSWTSHEWLTHVFGKKVKRVVNFCGIDGKHIPKCSSSVNTEATRWTQHRAKDMVGHLKMVHKSVELANTAPRPPGVCSLRVPIITRTQEIKRSTPQSNISNL